MRIHYQYFPYKRPFKIPLKTYHGIWSIREGIIISLQDVKGNIAQGEIAPLPSFGTETLRKALDFCKKLTSPLSVDTITTISDRLPCCQFAFESAFNQLINWGEFVDDPLLNYSYLLPTGKLALEAIQTSEAQQYSTFKYKIGVQSFEQERSLLKQLINYLPKQGKIRLDANGGLSLEQAKYWLEFIDLFETIEFIEQPLSPEKFSDLLTLRQQFQTEIALDESVSSFAQLHNCYQQGWRGIYILKAAIMGYPSRLTKWLATHSIDAVFSSVMETAIARQQVLKMAVEWGNPQRAIGFGVKHWFDDSESA